MKTKQPLLSKEIATSMYKSGKEDLIKAALEAYPELGENITDKVKTFEDACRILNIDSKSPKFNSQDKEGEPFIALRKLTVIAKALNEGWEPNWDDSSEYKYYLWFDMRSSGGGFSFLDCDGDRADSTVGSRLCFKSSELATYAGEQFTDLYKSWMEI